MEEDNQQAEVMKNAQQTELTEEIKIPSRPISQMTTQAVSQLITPSTQQVTENEEKESPTSEVPMSRRKRRRVRRKKKIDDTIVPEFGDIPGVTKIIVSPVLQKILQCIVAEDVTAENPWKYVSKELLEDNLELHEGSSEFLPIKEEILNYPRQELLLGYIPDETREYDEFYMCLTESADDTVSEIVRKIQQQREERLNNSIFKEIQPWKTQGSEVEVDEQLVKNNRPLLEVEVECDYPIIPSGCRFKLRNVQDARDGYAELLAGRAVYASIYRKRMDASVQVTPAVAPNEAQTVYSYPKNAITQYEYDFQEIIRNDQKFQSCMQSFIANSMDVIDDIMYVNSFINFYKDDYADLVKNEHYTQIPGMVTFKEYMSFADYKLCTGKAIASVSWHPMWSGTFAVAYSDEAPISYQKFRPNVDEVIKAIYHVIPVLLWSFTDSLNPKLYLETPREVSVLSFCPSDENLLVGGCVNGQIIMWDIKDRLNKVESEEVLSVEQRHYRAKMRSLTTWIKDTQDLRVVRATVVSNLQYSHTSAVTDIRWISPYREVSKSGVITDIPPGNDRSAQFITSSQDGTLLVWDILEKPSLASSVYRPTRKLRRLKRRPSGLTVDVSPFKIFNRVFKPFFKVNVLAPNETRNLPLTAISLRTTLPIYVEKYPDPNRKFNLADRIIYKPFYLRPTHPLLNQFVAGTSEGDLLIGEWDGFNFNAGEVVNKQTCRFINFAKYHDGPIVSLSRSDEFPNLLLTVGGKIFALWMIDFIGKPVLWRRCKHRYTHGVWNRVRPSIFRLTREDGCIELWHLKSRSNRYKESLTMSAGSLAGTFTQPFELKQNVVGVGDERGLFRLLLVSQTMSVQIQQDNSSTYKICEHEVERKRIFMKRQEKWNAENAEWVESKKEEDKALQQRQEEDRKREEQQLREEKKREEEEKLKKIISRPEPGCFKEWAEKQWKLKQEKRMTNTVLAMKRLDKNKLLKQQLPALKEAQDQEAKKAKQQKYLASSQKRFEEAVAVRFPDAIKTKPPPPPDPYGGGDFPDVKKTHFQNYLEAQEKNQKFVDSHKYVHTYNWLNSIRTGRKRRQILDGYFTRSNHKFRLEKEQMEQKEREAAASLSADLAQETPASEESLIFVENENYNEGEESVQTDIGQGDIVSNVDT